MTSPPIRKLGEWWLSVAVTQGYPLSVKSPGKSSTPVRAERSTSPWTQRHPPQYHRQQRRDVQQREPHLKQPQTRIQMERNPNRTADCPLSVWSAHIKDTQVTLRKKRMIRWSNDLMTWSSWHDEILLVSCFAGAPVVMYKTSMHSFCQCFLTNSNTSAS